MLKVQAGRDPFQEKPGAVLFDLDNTLYDYEPAHIAALDAARIKSEKLFGMRASDFNRIYEEARSDVKNRLGNTASAHSRLLYFQRLMEIGGLKTQPLFILDLEQTYWRKFLTTAKLVEGAVEFIQELQRQGIPRALVTDLTAQIQLRKLVYLQLDSHFDFVVTSEEIGEDKPTEKMFARALEKLDVNDGPIWMIGDNFEKDIVGAKKAIQAVTFYRALLSEKKEPILTMADVTFKNFVPLTRELSKLAGVGLGMAAQS